MELKDVLYEVQDGVGIITMNRPERLNASSADMVRSLIHILDNLTEDVRALIFTGAGRAFCAGGDVRSMSDRIDGASQTPAWQRTHTERAVSVAFWNCDRPIIAAVNGHAVGLGLSYASMCDFRIASDKAQFGALWVRRGFMPDAGGTYFLPFLLGVPKALEICWTGDIMDAKSIGLVSRVVPHEELIPTTMELAKRLAQGPTLAMGMAKRAMYKSRMTALQEALEFESYGQAMLRQTEDHAEGVKAFMEKREAKYVGR
jgi:2-(1,2-epoxy-1,2-dihydrophenyl)acetyl-CoA isomerase